MSLIYPFITRVDFTDLRKRQVRLVHQSVKEFVIRDWSYLKGFDTSTASSQVIVPRIESLEAFMLDICICKPRTTSHDCSAGMTNTSDYFRAQITHLYIHTTIHSYMRPYTTTTPCLQKDCCAVSYGRLSAQCCRSRCVSLGCRCCVW